MPHVVSAITLIKSITKEETNMESSVTSSFSRMSCKKQLLERKIFRLIWPFRAAKRRLNHVEIRKLFSAVKRGKKLTDSLVVRLFSWKKSLSCSYLLVGGVTVISVCTDAITILFWTKLQLSLKPGPRKRILDSSVTLPTCRLPLEQYSDTITKSGGSTEAPINWLTLSCRMSFIC